MHLRVNSANERTIFRLQFQKQVFKLFYFGDVFILWGAKGLI